MRDQESQNRSRCYVFAGGGSGGHLTPSLAVAESLLDQDSQAEVLFLTSSRDVDRIVMQHAPVARSPRCEVVALPLTQPPGLNLSGPSHLWSLVRAVHQSHRLLEARSADVVLATGAFAAVPGLMAAHRRNIPVVLFEANTVPGKVNRWWAKRAAQRFSAWSLDDSLQPEFEPVGMPVRTRPSSPDGSDRSGVSAASRQILVVGGSQGSRRLNELVCHALESMTLPAGWHILHQTGPQGAGGTGYRETPDGLHQVPFIDDIIGEMHRSELVISRAGAVTLGETAAAGCPAVLVPFEGAADGHQLRNAERFAAYGAAVVVREAADTAVAELQDHLQQLTVDAGARNLMKQAAAILHDPQSAAVIAQRLSALVDESSGRRRAR